jgi:uncharacterized protein (TIGR00369 family)
MRTSIPKNQGRSRSIRWEDPQIGAQAARSLSPLEYLEELRNERVPAPPIAFLIGYELLQIERGRAFFAMELAEHQCNHLGFIAGGIIANLLDSAMACAAHSVLDTGRVATTIDLVIRFARSVSPAVGKVQAIATVVHETPRLILAEARMDGTDGKLYATGSSGLLVLDARSR